LFRHYISLTKPGIIRGNLLTAVAGFFLASRGLIHVRVLIAMAVGLSLIVAAACVFNNYIDRGIDKKMARTKHRALVTGAISARSALLFATGLAVSGTIIMALGTTLLAVGCALFGLFAYVVLYGLAKRAGSYGTLVGAISGALPPVVGYSAVTGTIDVAAILLFVILVCWQMPHFYAIALYRQTDYASAGLPVLPVASGVQKTKLHMLLYIVGYTVAVTLLTAFGYTGYVYVIVSLILGLIWMRQAIHGQKSSDTVAWAKGVFRFSLIVISVFSLSLSLDHWLV
jgi:protoheme IX farnesyltransferase